MGEPQGEQGPLLLVLGPHHVGRWHPAYVASRRASHLENLISMLVLAFYHKSKVDKKLIGTKAAQT
ncbi:hypothetical protein PF010_g24923 [Phytophthora fragariae]|uniref:Uncharacterized protein n=1 Tax=Phytophthora fragariae TaxID=53985 RepID=A0A6G0K1C0_9STRA|nr:hypothetical protein PF010_g24923 [Phytophthora fragariae]